MKEFKGKLKVFFLAAVSLTVLCSALFTLSMITSFDADVGYFSRSAVLPYIQRALLIVSVIFFASIIFFIPKGKLPLKDPDTTFSSIASLSCGFLYIVSMIIFYMYNRSNVAWMTNGVRYVFYGIVISGIVATAFFVFNALLSGKKDVGIKTAAAVFLIANLIFIIIFEHIDYYLAINSVRKTLMFVGYVFAAVFIVQDLRFKAGIGQPRGYFFFGATTMIVCATFSVSHLIAHLAGALRDTSFLIYYLIAFGLAFYCFAKLYSYTKYVEYAADNNIEEITAEATEATAEENDSSEA